MAGSSSSNTKKADERRARNLASANVSRQRRREQISSLEQERARLNEVNDMLRTRLEISPTSGLPPLQKIPKGSGSRSSKVETGPGMRKLQKQKDLDAKVAVDLADRAVSGGKGKSTPLDPELVKSWAAAGKKAPKDVSRPFQHVDSKGKVKSTSKSKGSSSSKKR